MTRLDDYQSALLAADPEVMDAALARAIDLGGERFVTFVVDHGLGPLWHARTGRGEFHASRLSAEAFYLGQEHALSEIDALLDAAGIEYAVIKGGANRLLLYDNPAIRACHDLDLLVRHEDRVRAASSLLEAGFEMIPDRLNISHELVLVRGVVDVDLHWGLLREGRLRDDCAAEMLDRRQRSNGIWMLNAEDSLFLLLVHPAFAKHLAGWGMGLHRVADIVAWLRTQSFDWQKVCDMLEQNGVKTAAWTTLRWSQLLTCRSGATPRPPTTLNKMLTDTQPGHLRREWLDRWLHNDLSERTSRLHWARLLGFSLFLHDTPGDSLNALTGRWKAHKRSAEDLVEFEELFGQYDKL